MYFRKKLSKTCIFVFARVSRRDDYTDSSGSEVYFFNFLRAFQRRLVRRQPFSIASPVVCVISCTFNVVFFENNYYPPWRKSLHKRPVLARCLVYERLAPRSKALTKCCLIIAFALFFFSRNTPESNAEIFAHGSK